MRKRLGFRDSKAYHAARKMPPLKHKTTEPFEIMESEAVDWLIQQPEIRQHIWNKVTESGAVVFKDGIWTGVGVVR